MLLLLSFILYIYIIINIITIDYCLSRLLLEYIWIYLDTLGICKTLRIRHWSWFLTILSAASQQLQLFQPRTSGWVILNPFSSRHRPVRSYDGEKDPSALSALKSTKLCTRKIRRRSNSSQVLLTQSWKDSETMVENGKGKRQTGPECLSILFSQLVLYLPQLVWLLRQSMAPPRFLLYRGMAAAKMWVIQTSFSFPLFLRHPISMSSYWVTP